ncbi:MAG: flagellar biosynthetic protein FliO [Halioglobus sp.]
MAVVGDGESSEIFDTAYLFQVFGSLLLVFGCLFGLAYLLRRFNGMPMSDRKFIQIIGSAKVGSREKIVLLKAGEQELLVGVAAGSVRTLHVFGDEESSRQSLTKRSGDDFAKVLSDSVDEVAS